MTDNSGEAHERAVRQGASGLSALQNEPGRVAVADDIEIIGKIRMVSYGPAMIAGACFIGFVYGYGTFGGSWVDSLDERLGEVVAWRAKALEAAGREDEALALYEKALSATFDDGFSRTVASNRYADLLLERHRYAEAADTTRKTLQENGGDGISYRQLFQALNNLELNEEAAEAATAWHAWANENSEIENKAWARIYLGKALSKLDRVEEAIEAYKTAYSIHPTSENAISVASALTRLGDPREAMRVLDDALARGEATGNRTILDLKARVQADL